VAAYTFLTADLVTGTALAELPLGPCDFERRINTYGQLNATLPIADPAVAKLNPISATEPARTAIYVIRDGDPVWGGIIWFRAYDSQSQALTLRAAEHCSYWWRRRIRAALSYTGVDQLAIFQGLINYAQGVAGGNVRVQLGGDSSSGLLMTRSYAPSEDKNLGDALAELAMQEGGFDFASDVAWMGGTVPTMVLTADYPRRGSTAYATGWMWEFGPLGADTNVISYTWAEDGFGTANSILGAGSGSGAAMITSVQADTALINAGYPLLEDGFSLKDAAVQANLDAATSAQVTLLEHPILTGELITQPTRDPVIGSYTVGDEFRLRITDPRFPSPVGGGPGLDAYYRAIGTRVVVPFQNQHEEAHIVFAPAL
jgi:hypothetical protein